MLRLCITLFLVLALIVSLALVLEVLCNENNVKAGIAILQFNATALGLQISGVRDPLVARLSFPTDVPNVVSEVKSAAGVATELPTVLSQAKSAASAAATVVPAVISQAKSAASAAVTAGVGAITSTLPQNCSIGSRQFCVGSAHAVTCHDLPMNLSGILSGGIETFLQDVGAVRDVDNALRRLTTPYIQSCFILALLLMVVEAVLFIAFAYGWFLLFTGLAKTSRVLITVTLGLLLCGILVASTVILSVIQSKLGQLPAWIHAEQGALPRLSLVFLLCGIGVAVAGALSTIGCI